MNGRHPAEMSGREVYETRRGELLRVLALPRCMETAVFEKARPSVIGRHATRGFLVRLAAYRIALASQGADELDERSAAFVVEDVLPVFRQTRWREDVRARADDQTRGRQAEKEARA